MRTKLQTLEEKIENYYEDYKDGKITLEEREEKIQNARDGEYLRTIMENFDVSPYATPMERFETVKSYLYKECSNGNITIDEREDLISMFREDCYVLEEDGRDASTLKSNVSNKVATLKKMIKENKKKVIALGVILSSLSAVVIAFKFKQRNDNAKNALKYEKEIEALQQSIKDNKDILKIWAKELDDLEKDTTMRVDKASDPKTIQTFLNSYAQKYHNVSTLSEKIHKKENELQSLQKKCEKFKKK